MTSDSINWMNEVRWNADGLLPVIAQDAATGTVLMMAWMNAEPCNKRFSAGKPFTGPAPASAYGTKADPQATYKGPDDPA